MYCISCKPIVEKQLKDEKGVKIIKFDYMKDSSQNIDFCGFKLSNIVANH